MPFVPKDLTGRLFDNRAERRNKSQPDYTGTVNVHGKVFRISGWYNPPSERSPVATIGLALEDYDDYKRRRDAQEAPASSNAQAEAKQRAAAASRARAAPSDDDLTDDEIPF